MALYQNTSVTDSKIEIGNYVIYVATAAGTTVGGTWINLGAGMVKDFAYAPESYTSQAGNAVDPIQGIARETVTIGMDLIEYDGSSFSILTGGLLVGTSASLTVGGQTSVQTPRGMKLINTRKLASGSTQTTTYVINNCFVNGGFTMSPKSDNDSDPVQVYTFAIICKQYSSGGIIFTKTVA